MFVTLLFFVVNIRLPGDFVTSLGPMQADDAAALRESLGLDRSLIVQYFDWLGSIGTLDLGSTFSEERRARPGWVKRLEAGA